MSVSGAANALKCYAHCTMDEPGSDFFVELCILLPYKRLSILKNVFRVARVVFFFWITAAPLKPAGFRRNDGWGGFWIAGVGRSCCKKRGRFSLFRKELDSLNKFKILNVVGQKRHTMTNRGSSNKGIRYLQAMTF
jgi:hypothetical protein